MSAETNPEKRKKRLTGIALVVGGLLLWMFGCAGVTPASVFVSGFYRSDGTYVGSYNRQPPGSVANDSPFETAEWLGFFFVCSGIYTNTVIFAKRVFGAVGPGAGRREGKAESLEVVMIGRSISSLEGRTE